jgi:phosphoribosyl 1,2-cyclic phosphodiesterase|tara:strand:+ start:50 stop:865 length:816 start_codon:yes stop_codon:yes gene_type:complete
MKDKTPANETITFLGTGGARFMIISQILASGGLWLNLSGTEILIDPGPGCIVQSTKRNLRAEKLSAIIVSHRHLDHSADINVMIEAMTQGGQKQHGYLFAPADALETEPIIFSYLKDRLDRIEVLQEGKSYSVGNVTFTTPVRHLHRVETYGLVFKTTKHTFSLITDTSYFDGLHQSYGGELLIINVAFLEPRSHSQDPLLPADHLSVPDAERLIRELKPKVAILSHFGMTMWRAKPREIAKQLSQQTGVRVIAAQDGMKFDLSQLDSNGL